MAPINPTPLPLSTPEATKCYYRRHSTTTSPCKRFQKVLTISLWLTLLFSMPSVQSWQHSSGPLLLAQRRPQQHHHNDYHRTLPGGGFLPSPRQHRRGRLFEQTIGSSDTNHDKHSGDSSLSSNNSLGRRARFRRKVSNLWSSVLNGSNSNDNPSHTTTTTGSQLDATGTTTIAAPPVEEIVEELEMENKLLRETIRQLELENERLASQRRVVIENFEGEGRLQQLNVLNNNNGRLISNNGYDVDEDNMMNYGITLTGEELVGDISGFTTEDEEAAALWCDELEEDACPVEPTISFGEGLRDRAYWLVGLLAMQSCSGIILARNEALLSNHPIIIYFLTMLVGAGGNAGNQASVRVIRGIALGTLNERTRGQFLTRELKMAAALSTILSCAGFLRAAAFRTPFPETIAVTASLALIVFSSICLGAVLPLLLQKLGVDPAHSSTTIQVVMDILGVVVAVTISSLILDSPVGVMLINKLGG